MRRKKLLVVGFGINDYDDNVRTKDGLIKSYSLWRNMIVRCYYERELIKHPTYIGCYVCEEWKYFSNFKKWFDENYREGYHLDKDILIQGNKVYSPQSCCFVPQSLNKLLTKRDALRGIYPIGVCRHRSGGRYRNKFAVKCCSNGLKGKYVGIYDNPEQAFEAYKIAKYDAIRLIALDALSRNEISHHIYDALLNYKIV